jgi:hypothetical protein
MQISRIYDISSKQDSLEFALSGVLSEWLFAVGFWRNFNVAHGTMFDQFEEDKADSTVAQPKRQFLSARQPRNAGSLYRASKVEYGVTLDSRRASTASGMVQSHRLIRIELTKITSLRSNTFAPSQRNMTLS